MSKDNKCILCGEDFGDYGHNPFPLSKEGRACDECNSTKVIPARLSEVVRNQGNKNIVVSVRITPEQSKWMSDNAVSPSKLFRKCIDSYMSH